jgi:hypothetical protein
MGIIAPLPDAVVAKRLADPFAAVPIANHFGNAIGLQQS